MTANKSTITILSTWLNKRPGNGVFVMCLVAIILYVNTLSHDFTQDDAIVIYENSYVKQGFSGLYDIFSTDSFSGFFAEEGKSKLVSGGRYRPLTIALFSVVHHIFGESTFVYHLINVLSYSLTCGLLYLVIFAFGKELIPDKVGIFASICCLVFTVHPIHTEVVANVKGLDEIFSLLFSLIALLYGHKYVISTKMIYLLVSIISFGLAILSKESAAPFLILIPATIFLFNKIGSRKRYIYLSISLIGAFLAYMVVRNHILGDSFGSASGELMNNPFLKIENNRYIPFSFTEKFSSIILGFGKYIQLLFFPHPLSHDYYPRQFGIVSLQDFSVLLSIIMNFCLLTIAVLGIRKKAFSSYYILFFYATIFLVSNILFPIGTHVSERFLFIPSISFSLFCGHIFLRSQSTKMTIISLYALIGLIFLFSGKTITRNLVWKDDFTLFTTDVNISKNSAKVRNAAGGALLKKASEISDDTVRIDMVEDAIDHLKKAISIHPNYKEAHFLLGNGYSYLDKYDEAITSYENALRIHPYYDQVSKNLQLTLRRAATFYGSKMKNVTMALSYLKKGIELNPSDFHTLSLLGTAYGASGDHQNAIKYFNLAIEQDSTVAITYVNLGIAQQNIGLDEFSRQSFNKALQLDPESLNGINAK